MKILEVRCCCQPTKLLGYMTVSDDAVRRGAWIRGVNVQLHIDNRMTLERLDNPIPEIDYIELSIEEVDIPGLPRALAVKAEGHDAATLLKFFPGNFRERKP